MTEAPEWGEHAGLEHYRRAGQLLLEAKEQLEDGRWGRPPGHNHSDSFRSDTPASFKGLSGSSPRAMVGLAWQSGSAEHLPRAHPFCAPRGAPQLRANLTRHP